MAGLSNIYCKVRCINVKHVIICLIIRRFKIHAYTDTFNVDQTHSFNSNVRLQLYMYYLISLKRINGYEHDFPQLNIKLIMQKLRMVVRCLFLKSCDIAI